MRKKEIEVLEHSIRDKCMIEYSKLAISLRMKVVHLRVVFCYRSLACIFGEGWSLSRTFARNIALIDKPLQCLLNHVIRVLSVEPYMQTLLQHLYKSVNTRVLVMSSKCTGRLALFATVSNWALVMRVASVKLYSSRSSL